jgi:RimJ/RimL family protein N-acetyltransferase
VEVALADGARARVGPAGPEHAEGLRALHRRMRPESRYLRWFSPRRELRPEDVVRFSHPDGSRHAGMVCLVDGLLVGHASFDRSEDSPDEAEVAFEVDDAHHGRGIATLLLEALADHAASRGLRVFVAHVIPDNARMLRVLRDAGFARRARFEDGVVRVELRLGDTAASRRARFGRRVRAAVRRRLATRDP